MSLIVDNVFDSLLMTRHWLGRLKLCFELRHGRSVLINRWHCGPFCVQKPFYYEDNIPHVYLLHPPGGLVGGDQLYLSVNLKTGSRVLLTMPGSTKFYSSAGAYVYLRQRFNLNKDSTLEWLPQSNIFFSHSKVIIDSIFTIAEGARCIFFEMLYFNPFSLRKGSKDMVLNIFLSISLYNSYGLKERIRMNDADNMNFCKFGGYLISAIFFAIPGNLKILNDVRILIKEYHGVEVGGATLLDNLLVVRLLGSNNERIQMLLRVLWCFLRPIIIEEKPIVPRIWLT